jgi:hypothetical protein
LCGAIVDAHEPADHLHTVVREAIQIQDLCVVRPDKLWRRQATRTGHIVNFFVTLIEKARAVHPELNVAPPVRAGQAYMLRISSANCRPVADAPTISTPPRSS